MAAGDGNVRDGRAAPFETLTATRHQTLLPGSNARVAEPSMTDETDPEAVPSAPPGFILISIDSPCVGPLSSPRCTAHSVLTHPGVGRPAA